MAIILTPVAEDKPIKQIIEEDLSRDKSVHLWEDSDGLDRVVWIGRVINREGEVYGVRSSVVTPNSFSLGHLLTANILIVPSDLSVFLPQNQVQINMSLFQKRIPFILYAEELKLQHLRWIRNALLFTKTVLFPVQELFEAWFDSLGDYMKDWVVFKDDAEMWKKILEFVR